MRVLLATTVALAALAPSPAPAARFFASVTHQKENGACLFTSWHLVDTAAQTCVFVGGSETFTCPGLGTDNPEPGLLYTISGSEIYQWDPAIGYLSHRELVSTIDVTVRAYDYRADTGLIYATWSETPDHPQTDLYTIDPTTGEDTFIGSHVGLGSSLRRIDWAPTLGTIVGLTGVGSSAVPDLVTVDPGSGAIHLVGSLGIHETRGLTADDTGIYVADFDGNIYEVDATTGAASLLVETGHGDNSLNTMGDIGGTPAAPVALPARSWGRIKADHRSTSE